MLSERNQTQWVTIYMKCEIDKATETESRLVLPGVWDKAEWRMIPYGYKVSLGGS